MKKLFDVEITRYYSKSTTIVVEAESEQEARNLIKMDKDISLEISNRIGDASLSWADDSIEVYEVEPSCT